MTTCLESQTLPIHAGITEEIPASSSLPVLLDAVRPVGGVAAGQCSCPETPPAGVAEQAATKLSLYCPVSSSWWRLQFTSNSQSFMDSGFSSWKGHYPAGTHNSSKNCNRRLQTHRRGLNPVLQSCHQCGSVKIIACIRGQWSQLANVYLYACTHVLLNTLLPVKYDLLVSIWFLYGSKMKLVLSAVCQIIYCEFFPPRGVVAEQHCGKSDLLHTCYEGSFSEEYLYLWFKWDHLGIFLKKGIRKF